MKTQLVLVCVVGLTTVGSVHAQVPSEDKPSRVIAADSPDASGPIRSEPKRPQTIAEGGCYYPFPIEANDPNEPMARPLSLDRSAEYLDGLTLRWTHQVGCVTCHTTLPYLAARPSIQGGDGSALVELREFMEYRATHWDSEKPQWDAEVLITATSLAIHDAMDTGKLAPSTRAALDRMWSLQREDGSWDWLKANSPPFEHDDYYGAVLVAVGIGSAPDGYAADQRIADQVARLRRYLGETLPPSLHHACWLMWAEAKLGGVLKKELQDQKINELVALQKPDGGWSLPSLGGWQAHDGLAIEESPSDGYATGLAVFALRQAGRAPNDTSVRKWVEWLKANQR
ncbi:MAG: hypothetical protein O2931_06660, partial [Planctomycetota bacterium]|nr:hypothetical protein [Planctomycetota bacterium]